MLRRTDAKSSMANGECAVKPNSPVPTRFKRCKEPTNVSPLAWNRSRSPQRCGPRRHRQSTVSKGFFDGTDVVPVGAPPCCTVEITGHQVHLFLKQHCTSCKDQLLSDATLLGVNVTDVQRTNCLAISDEMWFLTADPLVCMREFLQEA